MTSRWVFTYGSLMYAAVWEQVVCGRYRSEPALLDGYRRLNVLGDTYPALTPGPGSSVAGTLYLDVVANDLQRLDAFEGVEYRRAEVTVQRRDGTRAGADVYLWIAAQGLGDREWDPQWFEREELVQFIARYAGGVRR